MNYRKTCCQQWAKHMGLAILFAVASTLFCPDAFSSPICSNTDTCLDYKDNILFINDRNQPVKKTVSLSSKIDSITLGEDRFYILTDGFIYAVTNKGELEDKLQIFFTPKSIQMMGGTLLVWKDEQLKFHLKHSNGAMKLEQVRGPSATIEHFSAFTPDGNYIYFYPDIIKYHNRQAAITLLVTDAKTITYIDESNNIVRRDHDYKKVPLSTIQARSLINPNGYRRNIQTINLNDLKSFIRLLDKESIRDEVLTAFINYYLAPSQFEMENFIFLLKIIEEKGPFTNTFQTLLARFKQLPDAIQRKCIAQSTTDACHESIVLAYGKTFKTPYDIGKIHFYLSNLPLSATNMTTVTAFMAEIINHLSLSEGKHVVNALQKNGQLYPFIKKGLERYAVNEMKFFDLVEPFYGSLSQKQRQSLFTLLLHRYRDTIQQHAINGGESKDIKTILIQLNDLVALPELNHLTTAMDLRINYTIDYADSGTVSHILLKLPLDFKTDLVDLRIEGSCNLTKTYEEKGSYTETIFFIVPVADIEALYEIKEYTCTTDNKTVDTLRTIKKKLLSRNVFIPNAVTIEDEWSFTNKTVLEKLSITPNVIGDALLEEANASPECKALRASCLAKCSGLNDSNGGFITNSTQESCQSYCAEAFYHCNSASK